MPRPTALIVDDEPDIRELLALTLERMDIDTACVADITQAKRAVQDTTLDLCLTDMRLPDGNGIDLVRHMQQHCPNVPVAMITAHGNVESAVEALKAGAFDFVSKPVDLQALRSLVNTALRLGQRKTTTSRRLIGGSAAMEELRATVAKLARSQAPIYISGESGTGKELVARMIHEQGPRGDQAFIAVNCGAIPEELMESEFFGHRKGSFTGAVADKPGLFQAADGGTLFLDEVAELPMPMQVKLLRAIQEKSIRPVGANEELGVDVRVLSATHKDLGALVRDGGFRQDLYYRVNVIQVHVPALRERPEDIEDLAKHIVARLVPGEHGESLGLSIDALETLRGYAFPGNVRELENMLERAVTLCSGDAITSADLRLEADSAADPRSSAVAEDGDLDSFLVNVEKETIVRALEQNRWNKTAAARQLGISFGALRYRMQKLGLD